MKAVFLNPARVEWLTVAEIKQLGLSSRKAQARLISPLRVQVGGHVVEIPAGFVTDFASVPKAFWSIFPATDPHYLRAAVVHDWGYQFGGMYPLADGGLLDLSQRSKVDVLFLDLMQAEGANWISRRVIFRAVRTFGWAAWRRASKEVER